MAAGFSGTGSVGQIVFINYSAGINYLPDTVGDKHADEEEIVFLGGHYRYLLGEYIGNHPGFQGMKAWLDKATEPEYGRVGYTSRGTGPARPQELMEQFPAAVVSLSDQIETATGVSLLGALRDQGPGNGAAVAPEEDALPQAEAAAEPEAPSAPAAG